MPTERNGRPFASGSKPTPDPYDIYLERGGFYRKHVPRDASSLFRVMSEQMFDSQEYHVKIRKDCVNFMIKNRNKYEEEIVDDFEKYTRKMVENQTPGTLLELKVMSQMFERNILLYRPFDLGAFLINEPKYKKSPLVRVFCTHEGHFDLVYTNSHIRKAGFCQSIVYETLYKNVFKLPDIEYSVEIMLHLADDLEQKFVSTRIEYANDDEYGSHIVFDDGRKFQLDRPEHTNCILKDPKLCHFHNVDFEKTEKELRYTAPSMFGGSQNFTKSSLSDKHTSCVRQLLNDGITPFSYKVAKALDPDMYRNVEFDSWSDARRNIRMKFGFNIQIGEKCLVSIEGEKRQLLGYIQEIDEKNQSCIVYIDALCEKRSVSMSCMRPLNVKTYEPKKYRDGKDDRKFDTFGFDKFTFNPLKRNSNYSDFVCDSCQCKSDHRDAIYKTDNLNQFTNISNFQNPHNFYEIFAYPIQYTANAQNMAANQSNNTAANAAKNTKHRNSSGQNHGHIQPVVQAAEKVQQVTIMKNEDKNGKSNQKVHHEPKPIEANNNPNQQQLDHQPSSGHGTRESSIEPFQPMPINQYTYAVRNGTHVYYPQCEFSDQQSNEMVPNQPIFVVQPNTYQTASVQGYSAPSNPVAPINYLPMQYGQWPAYNPQGYVQAPAQPISYAIQPQMPIIRSDLLISNGRPNYNANYSYSPMGDDLPMHDQFTLRFYYNLGIEYWKHLQTIHGTGPLMAMIDGDTYEQASGEIDSQHTEVAAGFQQLNLEDNITTPTPPKGNGKHYNDQYIGRRGSSFRSNRDYKRDGRDNRDNRDGRDNRDNRDIRPNPGQRFQGTFPGPTKTFNNRNAAKYHGGHNENPNNGRINTYDSTPIKEGGHKLHQYAAGHNIIMNKRETLVPVNEIPNPNITFGSNVPPFPYHLGPPPVNAIPRITPPVQERSTGVSPHEPIEFYNSGHHYNQYNLYPPQIQAQFVNHPPPIHHQMPTNFWMIQPPPNLANNQVQVQVHPQVQAQASNANNALNTSNISNMSSAGSNPSN